MSWDDLEIEDIFKDVKESMYDFIPTSTNWNDYVIPMSSDTYDYLSLYTGGWGYSKKQKLGLKLRRIIDWIFMKVFDL